MYRRSFLCSNSKITSRGENRFHPNTRFAQTNLFAKTANVCFLARNITQEKRVENERIVEKITLHHKDKSKNVCSIWIEFIETLTCRFLRKLLYKYLLSLSYFGVISNGKNTGQAELHYTNILHWKYLLKNQDLRLNTDTGWGREIYSLTVKGEINMYEARQAILAWFFFNPTYSLHNARSIG